MEEKSEKESTFWPLEKDIRSIGQKKRKRIHFPVIREDISVHMKKVRK